MKHSPRTVRCISALALTITLSGCISVPVVEQATHEKSISVFDVGCSKPYELKQDCGGLWGTQRVVRVDKVDIAVAATGDGKTVLVMDAHPFRHTLLKPPLIFNTPGQSKASNAAYLDVRGVWEKSGLSILRAIPVKDMTDTWGYFLELDGAGYDLLKPYTVSMR
jgi:hypothetical protein